MDDRRRCAILKYVELFRRGIVGATEFGRAFLSEADVNDISASMILLPDEMRVAVRDALQTMPLSDDDWINDDSVHQLDGNEESYLSSVKEFRTGTEAVRNYFYDTQPTSPSHDFETRVKEAYLKRLEPYRLIIEGRRQA